MGRLIKTWFTKLNHIDPEIVNSVLVTTCTAAKYEAHAIDFDGNGSSEIDQVLTTRELIRLIKLNGIDMNSLEPEPADGPFHANTSAGKLFSVAGGEAEATLRTIYYLLENKELPEMRMHKFRGTKNVREVAVQSSKGDISIASVSGLKNAMKFLEDVKSGKVSCDFIEIMACPDGCAGGGGQPIPMTEGDVKARVKSIYDIDKGESLNAAHKNTAVKKMYEEFARAPWTDESRQMLHASFEERKVLK